MRMAAAISGWRNLVTGLRHLVTRGSLFPFNKVGPLGGGTGDKLTLPYRNSVWVQRAIKKVAGPIAAVPLMFGQDRRGGEQGFDDPQLTEFWRKPARGLNFTGFIEATVGWLKLAGEYFWLLDDVALIPFPAVQQSFPQFVVARPDRMRHVVESGELAGWEFTDGKGRRHFLLPEQVIHHKSWNPYDEWRGLSELESAMVAAEADYLAGKFNLNLMRSNGDRGPYIVAKGGIPDDTQRSMIVNQLREKKELSLRGQFRPVFLAGDITVEDPQIQSLDANVIASRLHNRHEIFVAFGVPASMADVVASYSIGSASDRFILIEETCMPVSAAIAESVTTVARRQTGRALFAWFDWDEHSVMQQVRRERMDAAQKLWQVGKPMKAINDYLRLGMKPFPGWEVGYLPFSVVPVGTPAPEESEEFEEPDETDQAIEGLRQAFRARAGEDEFQSSRPQRELAQWREQMAQRRSTVKAYESRFNRELLKARAEVLARLEKFVTSAAAPTVQRAAAADFIFDLDTFSRGLLSALRKVGATALQSAGEQLFEELAKDDPFSMPPEEVLQFLRSRDNRLQDTPQEIFDQVKAALEEGLKEGESIAELSDRVRAEFNGISKERARTIAMTETAAAYGKGRAVAMKQAGVKFKRWLTSGNPNVRAAHAAANGQVVETDEAFEVGGESLDYPGDPNGSPGNVINCHCVSIAVASAENET